MAFCDVLHAGLGAGDGGVCVWDCDSVLPEWVGATGHGHQVPSTQGHFSCLGVGLGKDL